MASPRCKAFFENFSRTHVERYNISSVQCCLYNSSSGNCLPSEWKDNDRENERTVRWGGSESSASGDDIGMLLDLDEGTLSVYKNGRKLGVMKRGLAGPYCWVVMMNHGTRVSVKRGTIPS